MNLLVLIGRTTAPIELKQTPAGKMVATFSLAVKRPFAKETTDFFTICAWDKLAETMSRYINKGSQICIRGYLQTRSWQDQNGQKRYATEVVAQDFEFCETKRESEGNNTTPKQNSSPTYVPDAYKPTGDEHLPF
jgi:single-strand DNA-binding protein